jgi:hypothetical protein
MSGVGYAFLSVVRRGLAALVPAGLPAGDARVGVPVQFSVGGAPVTGLPAAALRGPGDVTGFDAGAIRRTWPAAGAVGAETNYLALAELDDADLPWRYTPDATASDRLAPWLCLVVLEDGEITGQQPAGAGPLPTVTVADTGSLPDLSQSWAWAHAQVLGQPDDPATDFNAADIAVLLAQAPSRLVARLLCPRQLQPRRSYQAFVVPAYERGRLAGTGQPVAGAARLAPAWTPGQGAVTLPAYASWSFQTGAEGDFASLAAKLHPAGDLPPELWRRQLAVSPPGTDPPAWQVTDLESALIPVGAAIAAWPGLDAHGFTSALQDRTKPNSTVLEPPLYGRWLAATDNLSTDPTAVPPWFHQLNGDPRARVAAGLGTAIVQAEQQQLLAGAWAQVAGIRGANDTLRRAQLARELALRLFTRHITALGAPGLLALSAPLHGQVRAGSSTLLAQLAASAVAPGALAPAWRRLARPLGTLAVRQGHPAGAPVAGRPDAVARMNNGSLSIVPPPPAPPAAVTGAAARLGDLGTVFAGIHLPPEKLSTLHPPDGFVLTHLSVITARALPTGAAPGGPLGPPGAGKLLPGGPAAPPGGPAAPPGAGKLAPEAAAFQQAAAALMTQFAQPPGAGTTWVQADLGAADTAIRTALNPLATIQAPLAGRLAGVVSGPRRTDPIEPVMAAPAFPQPMYQPLADLDRDWLLPGLAALPADTVALLRTNWRFVESFLTGLNHEMARKLLWNGYPTDQRGTYFRYFWDIRGNVSGGAGGDIGPAQLWTGALGENHATSDPLVLLVRGELIRRYPNLVVYAVPATPAVPGVTPRQPGTAETQPVFFGRVDPDIALFGFDLGAAAAQSDPGWFFVLQEHPSEPRFGLAPPDSPPAFGTQPGSWDALGWEHLAASAADLDALRFIDLNAALPQDPPSLGPAGAVWHAGGSPGSRAADIASITFQHPKRLAIHGSVLIPPPPPPPHPVPAPGPGGGT